MVRITEADFEREYERIKHDSVEGNCIIFVSSNVDAICACKIFQSLLKSDLIQHKLVPVSGYRDLEKANEELVAADPDLRSIIMINCGAPMDIFDFYKNNDNLRIYVIDSHRPLNLHNCLPQNETVRVFDDEADTGRMNQYIEAYEASLMRNEEDDDENISEDETDEDEDLEDMRPRQRRRLNSEGHSRPERRRQWQRQQRLLADYYTSGVYYSNSVAGQMYSLATQLAKTNNDLLWLAIIGVTAQYVFERIDTNKYMNYVSVFNDDVARFNLIPEDGTARTGESSIQTEEEYRFMLFRHWSLYDSMYHSGYVASKLSVWRDYGRRRLNNMFAKMGFSLQQCQQVYTHMDMQLKDMLKNKIETVAPLYGLTDICFPSFARTYGYKLRFSASDAVYALATLLETSPVSATRLGENVNWNQDEDWDALENETGDHGDGLSSVRRKWWMRNFYTAYDAINNVEGLHHGVELCMKIQKAVVRQGTAILDKKASKIVKNFRVVIMRDGPDLPLFQHPLTLSKLALFLTDAYREHASKNMPFVISSFDEEHDSFLVVANTGAPSFGDVRKNPFGLAFQKAANKSRARISFDSFETSVLQIHKNDLDHFLENLFIGS
ncbi:CDC45 family [Dichotomocladium elegans]|nr:CDC45 family [Dichotomocladium elegans]